MGWVSHALAELRHGRSVKVRPQGGSMRGRIESNQLVTLAPVEPTKLQIDDVVFVRWRGSYILHIIREIRGSELLIGNNIGKINGWAPIDDVVARVTEVAD